MFLLFNIGLELSFDRLRSMGKFVFGMGTLQVRGKGGSLKGTQVALGRGCSSRAAPAHVMTRSLFPFWLHYSTQPFATARAPLQVVLTLAAVAFTGMAVTGGALGGPGAIILGGGLALSTTAVGMQVRPG